ncbi:MAG: trypsin-like peptidase domain-containing protein [Terrimicrobiaceae bacterium]|nr:trypsin-like peptidase domain-containing protein [Terrimicrobiaceae bacterium]
MPLLRDRALPHVFLIESFDARGKKISTGTGFFVFGPHGVAALTNAHVVGRASRVECKLSDGRRIVCDGVLAFSGKLDLAALAFPSYPEKALSIETVPATVGESVAVLGNPLGLGDTLTSGIISALREGDGRLPPLIQITAPISPGSSGSPVINGDGKVIGIATSTRIGGQSLNFAVCSQIIWEFLSPEPAFLSFETLIKAKDKALKERIDDAHVSSSGDSLKKLRMFSKILEEEPTSVEAAFGQIQAYDSLNLHAQARASAEALFLRNPDHPHAWVALAMCDQHEKNYRLAERRLKTAIKLDQYNSAAWTWLWLLYMDLDMDDAAEWARKNAMRVFEWHKKRKAEARKHENESSSLFGGQ